MSIAETGSQGCRQRACHVGDRVRLSGPSRERLPSAGPQGSRVCGMAGTLGVPSLGMQVCLTGRGPQWGKSQCEGPEVGEKLEELLLYYRAEGQGWQPAGHRASSGRPSDHGPQGSPHHLPKPPDPLWLILPHLPGVITDLPAWTSSVSPRAPRSPILPPNPSCSPWIPHALLFRPLKCPSSSAPTLQTKPF